MTLEFLLPTVAVGFYLFDSVLLLYSNEMVFIRTHLDWDSMEGSSWLLLGRRPFLPNPLTPHVPLFRVSWMDKNTQLLGSAVQDIRGFIEALRGVGYMATFLLILLISLPIVVLLFGVGQALLAFFIIVYIVIIITLMVIYSRRAELGTPPLALLALSIEVLACPPLAVNLPRKLSLRCNLGDPVVFAKAAFSPAAFEAMIRRVCSRVEEDIDQEAIATPRRAKLQDYRDHLENLLSCQQLK